MEAPDLDVEGADRSSSLSLLTILAEIVNDPRRCPPAALFPALVAASIQFSQG